MAFEEVFAMDADDAGATVMPPDLALHDKAYHKGHYSGGKCKYREQRAAMFGIPETESLKDDQMDKLNPEDVEGEEKDKADAEITGEEHAKVSESPSSEQDDYQKAAAFEKLAGQYEDAAAKAPNEFVKKLLMSKAKAAKAAADKLGDGGAIAKMLDFAKSLGYEFDPAALKGILKKAGAANKGVNKLSSDAHRKLEKERDEIESDIESLKTLMSSMSPEGADELKEELDAMQKHLSEVNDMLSGKGTAKVQKDSEKAVAKAVSEGDAAAAKKAAKEAKKAAIAEMRKNQSSGATCALDTADDIAAGKTSVLSSSEFKTEMNSLPAADKIYAVSDFHDASMKGLDVSKFGTVIMAGDWTKDGATSHSGQISMDQAVASGNKWLQDHFFKFCNNRPDQQFVLVAGNHDHFLGDPSAKNIQWPSNVSYLDDSEAEINGMRVYGTPYCEKRKGGAKTAAMESQWARQPFELDDADAKAHYDKIPEGLDVLIVHQPPKAEGFDGDLASVNGVMTHCGSESLTEAIKRAKPKLVLCGHLHDSDHRPFKIGDSVIMNTAFVSGRSKQAYTPHEIGIERGTGAGDCGFIVDGEDKHIVGSQQGN